MTSRKSIHKKEEEDALKEPRAEKKAPQCVECGKRYLVKNGEEKKTLNEDEFEEWKDQVQAQDPYALPRSELPYTCQHCQGIDLESRKHEQSLNVKHSSGESRFSTMHKFLIILAIFVAGLLFSSIYLCFTGWLEGPERLKESQFDVNVPPQSEREKLLDQDIYQLEDTYTRQEERVWYTLLAGIKSVDRENPNQPSVFLMLYDSYSAGKTARCLAKDVVKAASKYLMGRQKEAAVFAGGSLKREDLLKDPGRLLVYLNNTVREKGSLVVTDLQEVPPSVAKSFHFICDKYSPLVETAVLFFTLSVDEAVGPRVQQAAEARLSQLWASHMDDSFLNPLITRMTPNILRITGDHYNC